MNETQNYGLVLRSGQKAGLKTINQMQGRIAELVKELGETKYNWGVSLHEIDSLRAERDSLSERVRKLTAECESLRAENERLTERVNNLLVQSERLRVKASRPNRDFMSW